MRNCQEVITQMLTHVPETETGLIADLRWNFNDAAYKAPEETLQWERTATTLQAHIPKPTADWHFEVLSIFMVKGIPDLRKQFL